jgi:hypothetical protein
MAKVIRPLAKWSRIKPPKPFGATGVVVSSVSFGMVDFTIGWFMVFPG